MKMEIFAFCVITFEQEFRSFDHFKMTNRLNLWFVKDEHTYDNKLEDFQALQA